MLGSNHNVQVSVKVLDQATDPLKRISDRARQMSKDFQSIGTSLGAFSNKMGSIATGLDKMANSMYRFNMYTSSIQRNLKALTLIGVGAATAVGVSAANSAIDFEFKTTKMQTKMNASKQTKDEISKYILDELNYIVRFTPTEIADLGIILGQAGISNKNDMKSLLKDTSYFSEAVDAVPAEAGQMLISTLKGFDMPISAASDASDKLAYALTKSLLQVEELPHALGQLAGRAKMYGQTLDSSLVALMVSADQGMPSAQAAQNLLFGLRNLTQVGNEDFAQPRRIKYYQRGGIDLSFFDLEKRQVKEYPEIIASLEKSLFNLGWMPSKEHFNEVIAKNEGRIPDGLIDKMMAMPMIQRVFGAAGQTPLVMGLQARYEEVDKQTGLSTGKVLYGSEALKRMRDDMQASTGLTEQLHAEMESTVKFNLGVLSGAWEASKIKFANDFLPVIKQGSLELVNLLGGDVSRAARMTGANFDQSKRGIDRFNDSIKTAAANVRKNNPVLADLVETLGDIATNSVKVGETLIPTLEQIGKATKDNLIDGKWGGSIWTFPIDAVRNGFNFIQDVTSGDEKSDKEISKLAPELQDSAKLTRSLIQGGVALVAAGAIVKIIELAFRTASTLIKGGKITLDVTKWLLDILSGGINGAKKNPLSDAMKNMTVTANVVNVYGNAVNGGGTPGSNVPGGPVPVPGKNDKPLPPRSETHGNKPGKFTGFGRALGLLGVGYSLSTGDLTGAAIGGLLTGNPYVAGVIAGLGYTFAAGSNWEKEMNPANWYDKDGNPTSKMAISSVTGGIDQLNKVLDYKNFNNYNNLTEEQRKKLIMFGSPTNEISTKPINNQQWFLSDDLKNIINGSNSTITQGFADVNKSLENVKIENKMNMQFNPTINITGDLKEKVSNVQTTITDNQIQGITNWITNQNRRHDN